MKSVNNLEDLAFRDKTEISRKLKLEHKYNFLRNKNITSKLMVANLYNIKNRVVQRI